MRPRVSFGYFAHTLQHPHQNQSKKLHHGTAFSPPNLRQDPLDLHAFYGASKVDRGYYFRFTFISTQNLK